MILNFLQPVAGGRASRTGGRPTPGQLSRGLTDYLNRGAAEGPDPHPLFDTRFYLDTYPDVRACGANPLAHFIQFGAVEGRWPHPLFDTGYYSSQCPGPMSAGANPLAHFVQYGAVEGHNPHPLFDTRHYLTQSPDVAASGLDPLTHYLTHGAADRRDPHPAFHTGWYLDRYGDEVRASGLDPLTHYVVRGAYQGCHPNPLFDSVWYLEKYPDVRQAGANPLAHYLREGAAQGREAAPGFTPAFFFGWAAECDPSRDNPLVEYLTRFVKPVADTLSDATLERLVDRINAAAQPMLAAGGGRPDVSILIPTYNNVQYTLHCLQSLVEHKTRYRFEVIVVDDCSPDERTARLLARVRRVRVVRNHTNLNFLRSCNAVAGRAAGNYLVLLNNDTRVLPGWLDELIGTFEADPTVGYAGSKLVYPTGRLQEAGAVAWRDGSGLNYGRNRMPDEPEYNYVRDVDWVSGASIALPKALWDRLGGFDEAFAPAYYEDVDLAFRVRQAGLRVVYQPFSSLIHFEGVTCGTDLSSGVKASQVVNAKRFHDRWQHVMSDQPEPWADVPGQADRADRRILVVDACTPTPDEDAGSVATVEFFKACQSLGYKVTFAPHNLAAVPRYTEALQRAGVECLYTPYVQSVTGYLQEHGRRFDAVALFRVTVAKDLVAAVGEHAPQARLVFHTVDLHHVREERLARLTGDADLLARSTVTREDEFRVMRAADATIVVSDFEVGLLRDALPTADVHFVPVINPDPAPGPLSPAEREGIVFVGGYRHQPNVDAVLHFINDILPLVRERLPDVTFYVLGSQMPDDLRRLESDRVRMVGKVDEVGPWFDRCRVSVAPLRFGAGMKGKVLTSMAHGVPCVTTPVGCEGMGLESGDGLLIADDAAAFADQVVRVYTDSDLWHRVGNRAVEYVAANYSRAVTRSRVRKLLNAPLKRGAAALQGPPPGEAVDRPLPGIELNPESQLELLDLIATSQAEAPWGRRPKVGLRYYTRNDRFPAADALIAYGLVRMFRPNRVLAVGDGFAAHALRDLCDRDPGGPIDFAAADGPDGFPSAAAVDRLRANDVLLLDPGHGPQADADAVRLFLDVIPRLRTGVLVLVLDVFHPFRSVGGGVGWPATVLRGVLTGSWSLDVVFWYDFLRRVYPTRVEAALPDAFDRSAGSIWLRVRRGVDAPATAAPAALPRFVPAAPPRPVPADSPPVGRLEFTDVRSQAEYESLIVSPVWYERRALEESILRQAAGCEAFTVPAYSKPAERHVELLVDWQYAPSPSAGGLRVPNWRERLICPLTGLNNRMRALVWLLDDHLGGLRAADPGAIYFQEQVTSFFQWAQGRYGAERLVGSEYLGQDIPSGTMIDGLRHEDTQRLSFRDGQFDAVISQEVMEHVPDPTQGFRELARVLRPGGKLFLSVPFYPKRTTSRPRGRLTHTGQLQYLLPPEYHGNPVDEEGGTLVFTEYGWDLIELLRSAGFSDAYMRVYWSVDLGHLGGPHDLFVATR